MFPLQMLDGEGKGAMGIKPPGIPVSHAEHPSTHKKETFTTKEVPFQKLLFLIFSMNGLDKSIIFTKNL